MLNAIVEFSVRRRHIVLCLAAALLLIGIRTAMHAKLDVFPDFVPPQAVIQTEAPGFSPEQVETLITQLVESAINGITNLESVRSQSIEGLSIVTVVFKEGTDIFLGRQMLNEQLSTIIDTLPAGVRSPRLTPLTSSTMDLLKIGLVSDRLSLTELRSFADWTLKPRLQAVAGVAQVGIMGGDIRQIQIQIDPARLAAQRISVNDLIAAAKEATGVLGAGYVETANQRIVIQSEGQSLTAEQIGDVVVSRTSMGLVRLKDLARVCDAPALKFGDALIQGRPGVLVKILSQYGSNTMEVTNDVEDALADITPALKTNGIELYSRLHRPATFIEAALEHVRFAILIGSVLVVVILLVFLLNLRAAAISFTAIPLSLLAAIIVMDWLGLTLNTITLGGLAIAIGEVVDDAIIDVENILRRLRENKRLGRSVPFAHIVRDASVEVRSAVVYATFVVILVFVPVLTMSGLQGRMFAPLGIAYILAILASLGVALTVTPAMASLLLKERTLSQDEPRALHHLRRSYQALLMRMVPRRNIIMVVSIVLFIVAVVRVREFGEEFLPEFREGHFVVQVNAAPGTSLTEMMRLGKLISADFLHDIQVDGKPVIETVEQQAGRAELGEDPWGPHRCELHVELKPDVPGAAQAEVQQQIREALAKYPGITYEVLTFLGDRIGETLTGETSAVVVNIFGDDLDVLDDEAQKIAALVHQINGAEDVRVASPPGCPQILVSLRHDQLKSMGFRPVEVLAGLQTAYQGMTVAQTYEENRVFDVVAILDPILRSDPNTIGTLLLSNRVGAYAPLSKLADINGRSSRYMILHEGGRRRQAVTCNVTGRDLGSFVEELKRRAHDLTLPRDVYLTFGGTAEAGAAARAEVLLHGSLVGLGIVLLLLAVFRTPRNLLLVLLNLPFAFVGGVFAVVLTGNSLSIGSIVGFVTLFGITMRNSMMMISHWEHLVTVEGAHWSMATAMRGASERLIPILMTAIVTGLGLLPIALGAGEVGREVEGPMAIVILGGLVTSTLMNLFCLPILYQFFKVRESS